MLTATGLERLIASTLGARNIGDIVGCSPKVDQFLFSPASSSIAIGRRGLLAALGGAAAAWPLAARAQQAGKLPTIGFLGSSSASGWSPWTAAFGQRLNERGWVEGRTVGIEYRWADGRSERFAEIAAEFVRLKVDVIVTSGLAVPAAKQV